LPALGIAPLAFAPPTNRCGSAWDWLVTNCQLTAYGVRVYVVIDAGGGYQTNGVPFNGAAVYGTEYLIQKNSNRALWTLAPNAMNNWAIGVQGFEPLLPDGRHWFDLREPRRAAVVVFFLTRRQADIDSHLVRERYCHRRKTSKDSFERPHRRSARVRRNDQTAAAQQAADIAVGESRVARR
jgi:hypothetical protein